MTERRYPPCVTLHDRLRQGACHAACTDSARHPPDWRSMPPVGSRLPDEHRHVRPCRLRQQARRLRCRHRPLNCAEPLCPLLTPNSPGRTGRQTNSRLPTGNYLPRLTQRGVKTKLNGVKEQQYFQAGLLVEETAHFAAAGRVLELAQRLCFDLANTFARHAELLTDFFQRMVGVHTDPKAHT